MSGPKQPGRWDAIVSRIRHPIARRFRTRRMRRFAEVFSLSPQTRVLDVGGGPANWTLIDERPWLVAANLYPAPMTHAAVVVADARALPFRERSFDVAFSNSLIEHVGSAVDQAAAANEISRCGRSLWVQTPNRRFFFDPHLLAPFLHWLPVRWHVRLAPFTPWALLTRPPRAELEHYVRTMRMLDVEQVRDLFPGAHIETERFAGMAKSIIAWRRS